MFEDTDADGAAKESRRARRLGPHGLHRLELERSLDVGEPSATSDGSGNYSITGVNPGTYTVRQVLPGGWTGSYPATGSYSVTLSAGQSATAKNFGSYTTGTIAGNVFEDTDADGAAKEAGEGNLSGRTVYLDSNGNGSLDGGEPSSHHRRLGRLLLHALARYLRGARVLAGRLDRLLPGGRLLRASRDQSVVGDRQGLRLLRDRLGLGHVYEDTDFDGSAFEAGDAALRPHGLPGRRRRRHARRRRESPRRTRGGGTYTLSGLVPGSYKVRQVAARPAGRARTRAPKVTRHRHRGSTATGKDFGSYVGASVSGSVFEDLDADGAAKEAGEGDLSGQRVYLDRDFDGVRDADEPTTLTDGSGNFSFTGIEVASWQVRMDLGSRLELRQPLALPRGPHADLGRLGDGQRLRHPHHGDGLGPPVLGSRQRPGAAGVRRGRPAGPHRLRGLERQRRRWTAASPDHDHGRGRQLHPLVAGARHLPDPAGASRRLDLLDAEPVHWLVTVTSRAAATARTSPPGHRCGDRGLLLRGPERRRRGPRPGPAGPAALGPHRLRGHGQRRQRRDGGSQRRRRTARATTQFDSLAPGTYTIRVGDQPSGWTCNYPSTCEQTITVEASESSQENDFGAFEPGTISGTKFEDVDKDGVKDAGEPGCPAGTSTPTRTTTVTRTRASPRRPPTASGDYSLQLRPRHLQDPRGPAGRLDLLAPEPVRIQRDRRPAGPTAPGRDFGSWKESSASGSTSTTSTTTASATATRTAWRPGSSSSTTTATVPRTRASPRQPQAPTAPGPSPASSPGRTPFARSIRRAGSARRPTLRVPAPVHIRHEPHGPRFRKHGQRRHLGQRVRGPRRERRTGTRRRRPVRGHRLARPRRRRHAGNAGEPSRTTNASGEYSLRTTGGSFIVRAEAGGVWTCSTPSPCRYPVTLGAADASAGNDFGVWTVGTASGRQFEDLNADGDAAAGEPGAGGWSVYADVDDNGERDPGEPADTTGAAGDWQLDLDPGTYVIREVGQADWTCSHPADCEHAVTVSSRSSDPQPRLRRLARGSDKRRGVRGPRRRRRGARGGEPPSRAARSSSTTTGTARGTLASRRPPPARTVPTRSRSIRRATTSSWSGRTGGNRIASGGRPHGDGRFVPDARWQRLRPLDDGGGDRDKLRRRGSRRRPERCGGPARGAQRVPRREQRPARRGEPATETDGEGRYAFSRSSSPAATACARCFPTAGPALPPPSASSASSSSLSRARMGVASAAGASPIRRPSRRRRPSASPG